MQATPSTNSHGPIRKGLRKGTHSCLECRRRRVRCVFEPNNPRCGECHARGVQCTRQDPELKSVSSQEEHSTRRRMQDLETLVGGIVATLPTLESSTSGGLGRLSSEARTLLSAVLSSTASTRTPALSLPQSIIPGQEPPALSLFDNFVLCRDVDGEQPSHNNPGVLSEKNHLILRELKCLLPNSHDLSLVLHQSTDSWRLWHTTFPDRLGPSPGSFNMAMLRDFIYTSINSHDLSVVAKVVLCLAVHIQQLPRQFTSSRLNLPLSLEALQNCYLNAAESLLGPDEELAGTLDGLVCMMIQSEYYINAGKPRKVWLILRRAIGFAQLLGLHHPSDEANRSEAASGRSLFLKLWQSDREVSLILGLPYAVADSFLGIDIGTAGHSTVRPDEIFLLKLGAVTGRIIHRNQNRGKTAFSATLEIDQELEECHDIMPQTWWQALPGPNLSPEESFTMLIMKLRYYNVRKLLHLPFMLKANVNRRYESSRCSTLEASRDMIRTYQILRGPGGSLLKMCAMVDFEVFTAAMILVIDLLANAQDSYELLPQHVEDWEIVRSIANDLRRISTVMTCHVAEQAAQLLDDFYEAHQNHSHVGEEAYKATIPYFGKLHIIRNRNTTKLTNSSTATAQHEAADGPQTARSSDPYTAPFMSFDDYLQCAPETFQPGRNLTSGWMSNLAVDDDWLWTPNSADLQ